MNDSIGRRRFVELGAGAVVAVGAGQLSGCASLATVRAEPRDGVITLSVRNYPQLNRPGGQLKVAPVGSARPMFVIFREPGHYLALSSVCTHLECTVELESNRIVCPCHGSTYDREGNVLRGPAERSLARYETRLTDAGELEIRL
ncbi:MAG: Rieske (2Fe-2S) protein [Gemmatimonadota bacterium]|nr:Rieske (2Fe-2S) protein [Gemmatimonadota bacterium]